jgi:Fe(3+) dicitrate transport protein
VSVSGNRLPYAPEWIASAAIGCARGEWLNLQAEVQYTGEMFTDDLNTVAPIANGQRGLIEDSTILNLAANFTPGGGDTTFFVTVKNATDELYIVDRARGILPGAPRLWQAGVSLDF